MINFPTAGKRALPEPCEVAESEDKMKFANREIYKQYQNAASISNKEASGLCLWVKIENNEITVVSLETSGTIINDLNWYKLSNGAGLCAPLSLAGIEEIASKR